MKTNRYSLFSAPIYHTWSVNLAMKYEVQCHSWPISTNMRVVLRTLMDRYWHVKLYEQLQLAVILYVSRESKIRKKSLTLCLGKWQSMAYFVWSFSNCDGDQQGVKQVCQIEYLYCITWPAHWSFVGAEVLKSSKVVVGRLWIKCRLTVELI